MLPTFLLIGAQKSGTTSLIHALAAHPSAYARTDELHFFDRHHDRGLGWYESCFTGADPRTATAVGESTPEYLFHDFVPPRIAAALPTARVVVLLRNPVDRAHSHYWHNRTRGHEPLELADALAAEEGRVAHPDPLVRERYAYATRGRYLEQLERVDAHVDRERILVMIAERLWAHPVEEMARLRAFLALSGDDGAATLSRVHNPFIRFRSQRLRGPIRRLPAPARRIAARLNARRATYDPMDDDLRDSVERSLAAANRGLSTWLGDDLDEWGGPW